MLSEALRRLELFSCVVDRQATLSLMADVECFAMCIVSVVLSAMQRS